MNNDDLARDLYYAVSVRNVENVERILAQDNACNIINTVFVNEVLGPTGSALHAAVTQNRDIAILLLKKGADVNIKNQYGSTPLHLATKIVAPNSFEVYLSDDGSVPFIVHYESDTLKLQLLLDNGANVNLMDNDGYTALHYASACGNIDVVELLLNNNADINITGKNTVVHSAAKNGHKYMVQFWLDRYPNMINLNLQDNDGNTALHLVAKHRFTILPHDVHASKLIYVDYDDKCFIDVAEMLLNRGIDTNIQNNDGNTALHLALLSYSGLLDITHLMMDNLDSFLCRSIDLIKSLCKNNNVNFILKNNDSYTVLDLALAIEHDQHKIAEHLQEKRLLWRAEQIKAANNSLVIIAENKKQILKLKPDSAKTDADKFLEKWRELPTEQILDTLDDDDFGAFQQFNEECEKRIIETLKKHNSIKLYLVNAALKEALMGKNNDLETLQQFNEECEKIVMKKSDDDCDKLFCVSQEVKEGLIGKNRNLEPFQESNDLEPLQQLEPFQHANDEDMNDELVTGESMTNSYCIVS
ncbi:ankyrin repeat-containing protein 16 [Orientia tsutsugamushi]|uniref:Ankyrin repeat-containing protein 16 n=3 Tax=Orientia tsutsugamushi TaxID=784 RepID=A0A2U3RQN5_ORITS|nr:ankyrin repeat domain-containing protein [Orientia tsutsugamushi]KJV52088.1 ankyrin repeat family protein [Orientia tsutsugamushi str. Karp]SPR15559.1 ankyrin repeat-containing protein 16 [Orientia tsutsugamushi]